MPRVDIQIRFLSEHPECLPLLAGWQLAEWGHLNPRDSRSRRINRLRSQCHTDRLPLTIVAFRDTLLAGSASLVPHDLPERRDLSPWLASVYVRPEYRRQGIGSSLVRRAVHIAARLAVPRLYLFTWDQKQLYKSLGWQVVARLVVFQKPVVIMCIDPE